MPLDSPRASPSTRDGDRRQRRDQASSISRAGPLLPDRESNPGLAVAVAVVQHVSPARGVEHPGVLDHFGIPARLGDVDPGPFVLPLPAHSIWRDRISNAVGIAPDRVPHFVSPALGKDEGPAEGIFTGMLIVDGDDAL